MRAGGSAPASGTDKGNILGWSGRYAGGPVVRPRGSRRTGKRDVGDASFLSRGESRNGGHDLKMTTLGNEAYVQSNISRFVMT
jgi:hypothetical protein